MCMVFCLPMFVYHMCAWYQQKSVEGIGASETKVKDGCESFLWVPGIDSGPLQEQPWLLTTEPFLYPKLP